MTISSLALASLREAIRLAFAQAPKALLPLRLCPQAHLGGACGTFAAGTV
jgi:hypothetical protein